MAERSSSAMDIKLRQKAGEVRDPRGRTGIPCSPWILPDRGHGPQRFHAGGDLFPEYLKHMGRIHPAAVILTPHPSTYHPPSAILCRDCDQGGVEKLGMKE